MKDNPYPRIIPDPRNYSNILTNVLLTEARKEHKTKAKNQWDNLFRLIFLIEENRRLSVDLAFFSLNKHLSIKLQDTWIFAQSMFTGSVQIMPCMSQLSTLQRNRKTGLRLARINIKTNAILNKRFYFAVLIGNAYYRVYHFIFKLWIDNCSWQSTGWYSSFHKTNKNKSKRYFVNILFCQLWLSTYFSDVFLFICSSFTNWYLFAKQYTKSINKNNKQTNSHQFINTVC